MLLCVSVLITAPPPSEQQRMQLSGVKRPPELAQRHCSLKRRLVVIQHAEQPSKRSEPVAEHIASS